MLFQTYYHVLFDKLIDGLLLLLFYTRVGGEWLVFLTLCAVQLPLLLGYFQRLFFEMNVLEILKYLMENLNGRRAEDIAKSLKLDTIN
jgi:hypothetical protein